MGLKVHVERRQLQFRAPLQLGRESVTSRTSWNLYIEDSSGCIGCGEAAPWPPTESLPWDATDLQVRLGRLDPTTDELHRLPALPHPSMQFALDTAWLDLQSKLKRMPLARRLNAMASRSVAVNAFVGHVSPYAAQQQANWLWSQGFRHLKLKLGRARFDEDLQCIHAVIAKPWHGLRADVNGAWQPEVAACHLERLLPFGFEYVEEPCHGLRHLEALDGVGPPIAVDESLPLPMPPTLRLRYLVLKPSRIGHLSLLHRLIKWAKTQKIKVTLTGMFEGPIAMAAIANMAAAWLPHDTVCGLTPGLFANAGWELHFANGALHLSPNPGLGC